MQCNREKAKEILLAEEARQAKSQVEPDPSSSDNNASKQGCLLILDSVEIKYSYGYIASYKYLEFVDTSQIMMIWLKGVVTGSQFV